MTAGIAPDALVVEASTLFGSHRQVVIGHNSCRYVLRITRDQLATFCSEHETDSNPNDRLLSAVCAE